METVGLVCISLTVFLDPSFGLSLSSSPKPKDASFCLNLFFLFSSPLSGTSNLGSDFPPLRSLESTRKLLDFFDPSLLDESSFGA